MRISNIISLFMLPRLIKSTSTGTPPLLVTLIPEKPLFNTTLGLQLPADNVSADSTVTSLTDYPIDPYQIRVPGTTTSLIFSKYGPPIDLQTFLELIAKTQYQLIGEIIAAHGDGPVQRPYFEWSEKKLRISISRPLALQDLTWMMLADTMEGLRGFFAVQGWFETSITILDDTAGPVGEGSISYG